MGGPDQARAAAHRVAAVYVVVGAVWIVASDAAFDLLGLSPNLAGNMVKGLAFVLITALVLDRLVFGAYRQQVVLSEDLAKQAKMRATLFDHGPEAMWVYDPETLMLLEVNDTMVERYGRSRDRLLTMRTLDLGPVQGAERIVHRVAGGELAHEPHLWLHYGRFGEHRWVEVVTHPIEWAGRAALLALSRDITLQKRAEDALRSSERRLAGVLTSMQEMAFSIDLGSGRISYLNDLAADMLGQDATTHLGTLDDFATIVFEDDWPAYHQAMLDVVKEGWAETEVRVCLPDGSTRPLRFRVRGMIGPSGRVEQVDGVAIDLTNRQELVDLVEHQRSFDLLTTLPNRSSLLTAIEAGLRAWTVGAPAPFVAMIDLDRFAAINQSAGHDAGDAVLVTVAERLIGVLDPGMTAARVGSDEFAVFCPGGLAAPGDLVDRLQDAVDDVFVVDEYEFFVTISVGVAEVVEGAQAEDLLRDAHLALSAAKERAAGVEYFHPAYRSIITEHVRVESQLRRALAEGQIHAFYQPQVSLTTDRIVGVEALARWQHPERGWLAAGDFIPTAERSGLIVTLDSEVLRQSCAQAAVWRERYGDGAPRIWVNVSRRELDIADVAERVLATISEHGLSPTAIGVEVTETAFIADGAPGLTALRALVEAGVEVALDDFGTGWSSLQVLKSFPIAVVKIDRSFITNVGVSVEDTQITQAVIGMAKGMSLLTLAEGVETGEQLAHLRRLGCDQVQGYLLGRPGSAATVEAILDTGGKPTVFVH